MKLWLGGLWCVFWALWVVVGIGMYVAPLKDATPSDGVGVGVVSLLLMTPGVVVLWLGLGQRRRNQQQVVFLGWLASRRRIRLDEAAAHLGMTPAQAERELERLIGQGATQLVFHEPTREYVHREDLAQARGQGLTRCPSCQAPAPAQLLLTGDVGRCTFCGGALLAPSAAG